MESIRGLTPLHQVRLVYLLLHTTYLRSLVVGVVAHTLAHRIGLLHSDLGFFRTLRSFQLTLNLAQTLLYLFLQMQ